MANMVASDINLIENLASRPAVTNLNTLTFGYTATLSKHPVMFYIQFV